MQDDAVQRFDDMVEAARLGTVFAHSQRDYRRWRQRMTARSTNRRPPLTDAQLEQAVMRIAQMFPDNVSVIH